MKRVTVFGRNETSSGEGHDGSGFLTMPIDPLEKDWQLRPRKIAKPFLLADELGFNEAYVGEHVTNKAENITSCIAFPSPGSQPRPIDPGWAPAPSTGPNTIRRRGRDHGDARRHARRAPDSASAPADFCQMPNCSAIWTTIATRCSQIHQSGARHLGQRAGL